MSPPLNGALPVAISYSSTPSAKMSDRWSIALPITCSGAIYLGEPSNTPVCVFTSDTRVRAMPKSMIFT